MLHNVTESEWVQLQQSRPQSVRITTVRHMLIRQLWTYVLDIALIFGVVAVLLSMDLWLAAPVVILSAAAGLIGTAVILLRTRGTQLPADDVFKMYLRTRLGFLGRTFAIPWRIGGCGRRAFWVWCWIYATSFHANRDHSRNLRRTVLGSSLGRRVYLYKKPGQRRYSQFGCSHICSSVSRLSNSPATILLLG